MDLIESTDIILIIVKISKTILVLEVSRKYNYGKDMVFRTWSGQQEEVSKDCF